MTYSNAEMQKMLDEKEGVLAFYVQDIKGVDDWVVDETLDILETIFQIVCQAVQARSLPELMELRGAFIEQANRYGLSDIDDLDDLGKLTTLAACAVLSAVHTEGEQGATLPIPEIKNDPN